MTYETISVKPVSPVIGAEINKVNLGDTIEKNVISEIRTALMEHQVLFFRDQDLTFESQKAFGRCFGELHIHPTASKIEGHPEILTIHADENSKAVAGMKWHSDVSCDVEPPMGSVLYLEEIPEVGGDTMFASMYRAYETLSEPIKKLIGSLSARHESIGVHRNRLNHKGILRDGEDVYPEAVHPIVRTHPVTQRKTLFVNENFTTQIEEVSRSESDAILKMLYDHIATPEFHCRFRWEKNSVAFWDNRCVQHRSVWDYYPQRRHGYRVTISGDKPY
ncbi:MAG: taurine dioxygenase [Rhodospirillaceae bacterium]|nr:taurine dioxygenase [Rhodospirillaceae bacterium]